MFGFPEHASDWTQKDYLRLFTFILAYIFLRPLLQKLYEKLGERQRKRDAKKTEDEQIRKHKQQRVREQLGIKNPEDEEVEIVTSANADAVKSTTKNTRRTARARRAQAAEQAAAEEAATQKIAESKQDSDGEMPSDEDVSDLIG